MIKKSNVILILPLLFAAELYSQNQKIGFIDSEVILNNMPEYSGIQQRMLLLSEGWRDELRMIDEEIRQLQADFDAREILFTDEVRQQRITEIEQKKKSRDQLVQEKFGPNGEYFRRQKELLEPIQRQIIDAINQIAEREGYDFIFDRAHDVRFLYAKSDWNLNRLVMEELGMDVDITRN